MTPLAVRPEPLELGGCRVTELARAAGTPAYAFDETGLREICRRFRDSFRRAWPRSRVAYACKAFAVGEMLRLVTEEDLDLDVVSSGELALALRAGVPPERITVHGSYKTPAELEFAVRSAVGRIVVDSVEELADLAEVARRCGLRQHILLRLNPGVEVSTDARYRASGAEGKFGLRIAGGEAAAALATARALEVLEVDGLHFHLGSQLTTAEPYLLALRRVAEFLTRETPGWRPRWLVIGGGMGVHYVDEPMPPAPERWADELVPGFRRWLAPLCADDVVLGIEPGRAIAAPYGMLLYTVGLVRPAVRPGGSDLVVVDGGLSDNPRPLMYSARHQVVAAAAPHVPASTTVNIYGRHCETDLLFADVPLPPVRRGDVLAVLTAGAYTHCMASNYNRFCRAPVVFAANGTGRVVVRRETPADLLATDLVETGPLVADGGGRR
ncbi:diaminopimelate decarboxylase [Amycolatopsis anabasis]|uniref:diaminopimelate decarboxylase n=1 Tax=Amycolatopsis anabasis TaxID=1840409 RepID=UPI00131BB873|nr:diaminopimelate decarboxylase [Amycolatopsis anabasis]